MPLPDVVVNRSSPVPLYFQVAEQIEGAIQGGQLAPGDRIANEVALADQLGLSRPTVRQAIQTLVDKGLLVRKRGVGTQVVNAPIRRTVELTSLYDDLTRSGLFRLIDYGGIVPRPVRADEVRAADWRARGADAVVVGSMRLLTDGRIDVRFALVDAVKQLKGRPGKDISTGYPSGIVVNRYLPKSPPSLAQSATAGSRTQRLGFARILPRPAGNTLPGWTTRTESRSSATAPCPSSRPSRPRSRWPSGCRSCTGAGDTARRPRPWRPSAICIRRRQCWS